MTQWHQMLSTVASGISKVKLTQEAEIWDDNLWSYSVGRFDYHMICYNSMPLIGWNYSIKTGEQIL